MFVKAQVEAVLHSGLNSGNKEQQFKFWNEKIYNDISNKIKSNLFNRSQNSFDNLTYTNLLSNFQESLFHARTVSRFFNRIPDNSLIAKIINQDSSQSFVVCYPFFSSHILLPVKPGEVVWIFKYENDNFEKSGKINNYILEPNIEKRYWLSRVHGESFSEDLNFTHHDRAFLPSIVQNEFKDISFPDLKDKPFSYNQQDVDDSILINRNITQEIISKNLEQYENFTLGPVLKTVKNPGDLIIQGSNNNSILLGGNSNNEGDICLVAGKGKVFERRFLTSDFNFAKSDAQISGYIPGSNTSNIVKNNTDTLNYFENFKHPDFYEENIITNEFFYNDNPNEGELNFIYDSSIFTIMENSNKIDFNSLYNLNFKNNQGKFLDGKYEATVPIKKNISGNSENKKTVYMIDNQLKKQFNLNYNVPGIVSKTNNFTLVARKNDGKYSEDGKICLIKDSATYSSYSHIIMDTDGNINIDGSKILIGNSERKTNEVINNGEIMLGFGPDMEPVVKGEYLKNVLENMITNITNAFEIIAKGMDELSQHTHPHPFGPTSPPTKTIETVKANTEINKESAIQIEMKEVSKNLNQLLSEIVRTS